MYGIPICMQWSRALFIEINVMYVTILYQCLYDKINVINNSIIVNIVEQVHVQWWLHDPIDLWYEEEKLICNDIWDD